MRSLVALLFVVGCAKSAGLPGASPPGSASSAAVELDSLERDLSASEQELGQQVDLRLSLLQSTRSKAEASEAKGDDKDEAADRSEKPKSTAPEPVAEAAPATRAPADRASAHRAPAAEPTAHESPCDGACRALGSMRRSANRICVLAGGDDARCTRARERVRAAEDRVTQAGCSCAGEETTEGAQPSRK